MMARTFLSALVGTLLLLGIPFANANADQVNLSLPDANWAVQLQLDGFEVDYQEFEPGLSGRSFQAHDSTTGLVASVLIDPAVDMETAVQYRDRWLDKLKKQGTFEINALRVFETDGAACFEYVATVPDGPPEFDQKNVYKCLIHDRTVIAIHLSKVQAQSEDEKLFNDFLENVRIVEDYSPSAIEHYVFGTQYSAQGENSLAFEELSRALNLERADSSLPESVLVDLIDRLSRAYAGPGGTAKQRETFEYGLARFPNDPNFHYQLARVCGNDGDLDNVLSHLSSTCQLTRGHGSQGGMPDPMKDPAFVQFRDNDRFRALCDSIGITSTSTEFFFTLPDFGTALEISLNNPKVKLNTLGDNLKSCTFDARDKASGLLVSVFLAEEQASGGLEKLQEFIREGVERRSHGDSLVGIEAYTSDSIAYLSYTRIYASLPGTAEASHLWVMTVRGKAWLSVHLSLDQPQSVARVVFDDFLANLQFRDDYSLSSMDDFRFGSYCYQRDDFGKACEFYEAGLELEKRERTLPQDVWLVLVDNLGMSYGMRGKPRQAQRIFEYGISEEPDYPMFHYNLACAYAEQKHFDQALASLEEAFKHKDNMIEGETLPDPREDRSFKRLKKDKRLRDLVKRYIDKP